MAACPVCDFKNMAGRTRCLKCDALLKEDTGAFELAGRAADAAMKREPAAVSRVAAMAEGLWRRNPIRRFWIVPEVLPHRFPWTAGLLSALPGGGQLYNGQPGKAALFAAAWWAWVALCVWTLREPYSNLLLLALALGWLTQWSDAIGTANRVNGSRWTFLRHSLPLWFGLMAIAGAVISFNQFFLQSFVTVVSVTSSAHGPGGLRAGDMIAVDHMTYFLRRTPALGEVVYFDPERFTMEKTGSLMSDTISVNIGTYFQRVIGLAGDKVERRGGKTVRAGRSLEGEHDAYGGDMLVDGTVFEIPAGSVLVPVTGIPVDVIGTAVGTIMFGMPAQGKLGQSGWIFKGWEKACLATPANTYGRAVAIVNPPERRRWLTVTVKPSDK